MSLDPNTEKQGGDQDVLESFPREWIARQVAWERRLSVLSRRAEAALEERAPSAAPEGSVEAQHEQEPDRRLDGPAIETHAASGALYRLFGRRRVTRPAHLGRRSRQKIAA